MFVLSDRVKESSTSQGLLDHIVLNDTYGTFQSFASGIGDGNNTYYTIENNNNYEIGIGLYQESGNKLFRNTILDSSHEGGKITLLGVSTVFCTYPADRSVFLNENGFMSGQYPHYSGVAFSDGSIQTHAFDGRGSKDFVAFWTSPTALSGNRNLQFDIANNTLEISGVARFDSDVFISGNLDVFGTQTITNTQVQNSQFELTTLSDTTFRLDDTAGCFFHAYVDNAFDNTIALHSTNEANPTWKLGLKDYSPSFSTAPSRGYIFGDFDTIGGFATENHGFVVNATNGFWVKHLNADIFNVQRSKGLTIYNDSSVVVPLNVRAAAGQSSNLQEWKDYSESVLASISSDGQISVPSIKFPDGTVQTSVGVGIVTSGIIGSGTTNFIPKFSDTNTITDSIISESGGKIGIGTGIPDHTLDVVGSFRLNRNNNQVLFGSVANIFNANENNIDFRIAGDLETNLFYVDASQNTIGINTDSPTSRLLTIRGKASPDNNAAVLLQGSGVGTTATDGFLLSQAHDGTSYVWNFETKPLIFANDNTERMRLESDGKLSHYGTAAKIADGSTYELDISSSAATLGGNRLQLKSTETVFNEAGANYNFRIEGDTNPYLFHLDAALDNVAIGRESIYPNFAFTVYRSTNLDDVSHLNSARGIHADIDHHASTPGSIHKYSLGNSINITQNLGAGVANSGYVLGMDVNGLMTGAGKLDYCYGLRTYSGAHRVFEADGRIKHSYGILNRVLNLGSGIMENAYGQYITISAGSNGTIGNAYGVFIEDNAGTIASGDYGIYQNGASACNYFGGKVGIGTDSPTQRLDVNSSGIRIRHSQTPASGSAAGNQGDIVWDTNYVYICVETNTWKRSALSTF